MKALVTILCCGTLMLGPALAGAMGWFGSKENIPNQESAPAETSETSAPSSPAPKVGVSTHASPTPSVPPAQGEGTVPVTTPAIPQAVPTLPPTGGTAVPLSAAKAPSDFPPTLGTTTTLPAKISSGRASLNYHREQDVVSAKPTAPLPAPAPPSAGTQVSPALPPSGETAGSKSEATTTADSQQETMKSAVLPVSPSSPAGAEESGSGERPELAPETGGAADKVSQAQPDGTSTVGGRQPASTESLRDRFTSLINNTDTFDKDELAWEAADCGCVPALSSFETYGFYPFWARNDVGKVNFDMWSRIGYYALTPNETGHIEPPKGWGIGQGKKQAALFPHRYGTKVDLVIRNKIWAQKDDEPGLLLNAGYVQQELVDNIVALVSGFGFDGVTIDFDFSDYVIATPAGPKDKKMEAKERKNRKYIRSYIVFIKELNKALKAQNKDYRLHVVLEYYPVAIIDKLPRPFNKQELGVLADTVDLLLFVPSLEGETKNQAMKQYDDYFVEYEYGEAAAAIEKKLVFMLDTTDTALKNELADIRGDRFGGVGGWMPHTQSATLIGQKLKEAAGMPSQDYVARLASTVIPGPFCKLVCPNRFIIGGVAVTLIVVYAGVFLVSFFSPVVVRVVNAHLRSVLAGVLVIVLLFLSLVSCVPQWWEGWQAELTSLLLVSLGGYAIKSVMDKRREANYP